MFVYISEAEPKVKAIIPPVQLKVYGIYILLNTYNITARYIFFIVKHGMNMQLVLCGY